MCRIIRTISSARPLTPVSMSQGTSWSSAMIDGVLQLPQGRTSKADLVELLGPYFRDWVDPVRDFRHGFRQLTPDFLRRGGLPDDLARLLRAVPRRYRDLLDGLRGSDGASLLVPVGFDQLAAFCMLFSFDSGPIVFGVADVRLYANISTH